MDECGDVWPSNLPASCKWGRYWIPGKTKGLPLILIPTTAGTGTEVTQAAVMEDPETNSKKSIWDPRAVPDVAIVDPELTKLAPPSLTAVTAFDALFHGIEGFTAKTTNPVAQMYCCEAIRLIATYLRRACRVVQRLAADVGIHCHLKDHGLKEEKLPEVAAREYNLSQRLIPMDIGFVTADDVARIFKDVYEGTL